MTGRAMPALRLAVQEADGFAARFRSTGRDCAAGSARRCAGDARLVVRFVDADEGRALNRELSSARPPTNVLTFD